MCTMMAGVVLVVMGLTGSGTAVRFIPRPVVIGFTNGIALVIASTQIKDFFGITLEGPVPGELVPRMAELAMHADTASLPTTLVAAGVLTLIIVWNRLVPRVPGYIVALVGGTIVVAAAGLAARDDWHPLRRHSGRPARRSRAAVPRRPRPDAAVADADDRHARRDRVAAVSRRRRSHEQDEAQLERRAVRAGRRQHRVAAGWRPAGDRRHRADRHQRPLGREDAGRRDHSRLHAARHPAVCRAAGRLGADGGARGHSARRRLQHGRVARDPRALEAGMDRPDCLAVDVRADRARRSHGGGRGRDDHRRAAVHPPRVGDDDRVAGDAGLHPPRPRARAAGQGHPGVRHDLPHPRAVSVRVHRQAGGGGARRGADADRRPASAQHDGDRCDRPAGDSGSGRFAAGLGAGRCCCAARCRSRRS